MGYVRKSKQDEGDAYFSFSYGWAFVSWFGCWWYCCWNALIVNDFWCYSRLKVSLREAIRAIAAPPLRRVGILRKTMSVFQDVTVVAICFWAVILPVLEYCSPVWLSAATSHMSLLDCVVGQVSRLSAGSVSCDLWHRLKMAYLCVFFKIHSLVDHPVHGLFPAQYMLRRPTRGALAAHSRSLRCLGLELCSFRTLLFCFVFDCGMGCMNLSLLVNVWVLLKIQSIAFFYKDDYFFFIFHFPGT